MLNPKQSGASIQLSGGAEKLDSVKFAIDFV